jgi:hypothetical protein
MMARELGIAYQNMTTDMAAKLNNYRDSLQFRFGDPRQYQREANEIAAQEAAILYTQAKSREEVMRQTYATARKKVRDRHDKRVRFTQDTPPESEAQPH